MDPVSLILIAGLVGGGLGVGGTLFATKGDRTNKHDAAVEESRTDAVEAAAAAPVEAVVAVVAEDVTDAESRRAIAESDAGMLAVQAAVTPGATRQTIALAAYALCIQGAQGKGEGSAAFGCTKRGEALDAALLAIPSCPEPVEGE